MLHIPPSVQEYVDLVPGLREHVHDGHVATPLSRELVAKLISLAALIEASFTESAAVKAVAAKLKIQAVLMSTDTREYIEELAPNTRLPANLHSTCSDLDCKLCLPPLPLPALESLAIDEVRCKCARRSRNLHEAGCPCLCTCACEKEHHRHPTPQPTHVHPVPVHPVHPVHVHPTLHHPHTHRHASAHDECHAQFRQRYAELKEQYARRHAELKDTYERKYATLKTQYVERELEIKCRYDERHFSMRNKYNELKRRYEAMRGKY